MPDGDDENEQHVVLDGIDDAVVTGTDPELTGTARESSSARGSGFLGQHVERSLDAPSSRRVESSELPHGRGEQLDAVRHASPRSALTSAQGIG